MQPIILLIIGLVLVAFVYFYMTYRTNAQRRAHAKKRNQYNDRV